MKEGFLVNQGEYAAVPFGQQLMILHKGQQLRVCKTESSARKYINEHKKVKSTAQLPI